MKSYVFDIECDGLLEDVTKIHSLVMYCLETDEWTSCTNHTGYISVKDGLKLLADADLLIGHNIIKFDIPVIQKLYPSWTTKAQIRDTLLCTRLIWPDISDLDYARIRSKKLFPPRLIGRQSLEAWGFRLRDLKGDFCKETDWKEWSKEMQDYCEQDVEVTRMLWRHIQQQNYSEEAIQLEHDFQFILWKQEQSGFPFDHDRAVQLYVKLSARREQLLSELQTLFPPKKVSTTVIPKRNNKTKGWVAGVAVVKTTEVPFNPSSRQQIAERLKEKYHWKPTAVTDTGHPIVDETALSKLEYPETKALSEYLMIEKRIGQLAEGNNAWLKLEKDGVIHGQVITNGAVTGRCTHNKPNMAQVPAVSHAYGTECRSLFTAPKGWSQVGCDASGLELRCLAHYMAAYDDGQYAHTILTGDIHTANQEAAGLPTRDLAKRFIYAFNYGAGDTKLGSIIEPDATEAKQKQIGQRIKTRFFAKVPALKRLVADVQNAAKRGWLKGLDGRKLKVRSQHSALNTLLQSAGAVVMKKATVILWQDLEAAGYQYGRDVIQMAHVHDEYQLAARPEIAEEVGKIGIQAITKAGEYFHFRCPLAGEYKVGQNWADCH